ncbi:Glycoside hydrolase family 76 protein [Mycena kentingensis (nom. inval.)]|nr:Glycoside hydrolase family 76 protein [Mycena kentingensis (nom. inval.)]
MQILSASKARLKKQTPRMLVVRAMIFPPLCSLVLALACILFPGRRAAAAAQAVSPLWRKSNITTSLAERRQIANDALQAAVQQLDGNGQFSDADYPIPAIFYSQLAAFDTATNGTRYRESLMGYFAQAEGMSKGFGNENVCATFCGYDGKALIRNVRRLQLHYTLLYGYAAAQAYIAYGDSVFLTYAEAAWEVGSRYTITRDWAGNVSAGAGVKSFEVATSCGGASVAGGTFGTTRVDDTQLTGLATGHFAMCGFEGHIDVANSGRFSLSALLASKSSDPKYLLAAQTSVRFILTQWLNGDNVVLDGMSARKGEDCTRSGDLQPYDSGMVIEALAIFANAGMGGDSDSASAADMAGLMGKIVQGAVEEGSWQRGDGVIENVAHGSGGDLFMARGLIAAHGAKSTSTEMRRYIGAYLAVQYNAVLDLARSGDLYGNWVGPPATSFSSVDQTSALGVLVAAVALDDSGSADGAGSTASGVSATSVATSISMTSSTSTEMSQSLSSERRGPPIPAVVAGVVSASLGVVLIAALLVILRFRRKRLREEFLMNSSASMTSRREMGGPAAVTPFTSPVSTSPLQLEIPIRVREKSSPSIPTPSMVSTSRRLDATGASQDLPTDELMRILAVRLQQQQWSDDAPPRYPDSLV